jgi:putative membrane protein
MFKPALAAAAAVALLAAPLIAQTQTGKDAPKDAKEQARPKKGAEAGAQAFVTKAAQGGLFEVESSKLATERAKREEVKIFAQRMLDDHGKANKELQDVAGKAGASVPDKLDDRHLQRVEKLRGASGDQFDNAYIDAQVDAHKEAVSLFEGYAKSGDNPDLKTFAARHLPMLKGHEAHVRELDRQMSSGATGKSAGTSGKAK